MSSLDRKLFRDFAKMKVPIASRVPCHGLRSDDDDHDAQPGLVARVGDEPTTNQCRFGEVFCNLKRAPNSVREKFAAIPGVASFQTQLIETARIDGRCE
jgi:hypothetical protein